MMRRTVVKFGGSLITNKDLVPESPKELMENADKYINYDNLNKIVDETVRAVKKHGYIDFLWIVHGVGPFGHYLVQNDRWKELGSMENIHRYCRFLNNVVCHHFIEGGLHVAPVHPFETCNATDSKFDITELFRQGTELFNNHISPITYGDIVRCYKTYKPLSGDDICVHLAKMWKASIIMVTDVDVCDKDPKKSADAKVIKEISKDEVVKFVSGERIDVTGGIGEKIRKLQQAAKEGIFCQIINGTKKESIYEALMGDEDIGTKIV